MDFTTLFGIYYGLYRGEAVPPGTSDDEWKIAIRNYNNALNRMNNYDATKWNFLFNTLQVSGDGESTLVLNQVDYACPDDMQEPGGILTLIDNNDNRINYQVVQPHQVQTISQQSTYGYFTGNPQDGFTLHVNPAPNATTAGWTIDYTYYAKPTLLDVDTEDGTTLVTGPDPGFLYSHMLAQRFRVSRNWIAWQSALREAEEALKGMKLTNNSGSYYTPWSLIDSSGSGWGL